MKITATQLRTNLFEVLNKVTKGHVVNIELNGKEIGQIIPMPKKDWRTAIKTEARLLKNADDAFAPLDDIWEGY